MFILRLWHTCFADGAVLSMLSKHTLILSIFYYGAHVRFTAHFILLRLRGQVPVTLYVFSKITARRYYLYPPPLMLSTQEIHSLLQQALPSSLTGCTTFWQTQVCVHVYACVRMHATGSTAALEVDT